MNLFIEQVEAGENIRLESEKAQKNPALSFMAKLLRSSLLSKLAPNLDKKKVDIVYTYDAYWSKITDDGVRILSEIKVNDNTLLLQWKNREQNSKYDANTSLAVAAFVTSYARLVL